MWRIVRLEKEGGGQEGEAEKQPGLGRKKLQTGFPTRVLGDVLSGLGAWGIEKLNRWQLVE